MLGFDAGSVLFNLSVALGIGLLVGAERERQKGEGPLRRSAGIRTFSTASLCGFAAQSLGSWLLLATTLLVIGALSWASYQQSRQHDPGMTSEIAILLTFLLGAMSVGNAELAAVIGIVMTALLAQKKRIHQFVRKAITQQELEDLIVFLAAIMIILPLAPDRFMGPFGAVNWHQLTRFVILIMTISALGHILKRLLSHRGSLLWAGFLGGFVSSTATVISMARLTRTEPGQLQTAAAAALLSTVSKLIQLGLLVAAALPELLTRMLLPMGIGVCVSLAFALWTYGSHPKSDTTPEMVMEGHAFDLMDSLWLAFALLMITVITTGLNQAWGDTGALASAALSGLVDAHATVSTMGGLVEQTLISPSQAQLCIWLAVSTNSISKAMLAAVAGGKAFALKFLPGIITAIATVWLSLWAQSAPFWL